MLTTECNAEPYIRWFDGYLTWHWQYDGQVPAFPAVYGGAIQMFGRGYGGGRDRSDLALRMKAGQQLVFGEQIGWIDPGVVDEKENADFLRQVVRLRLAAAALLLRRRDGPAAQARGRMPTVRADWRWGGGNWWVTTDAVLTGAWRLPKENRVVIFFVNVSDKPVTAKLALDAAAIRTFLCQGPGEGLRRRRSGRDVHRVPRLPTRNHPSGPHCPGVGTHAGAATLSFRRFKMAKKVKHMGMMLTEAEHDRWQKRPALTPAEHRALMKKMGVSKEQDEAWHKEHGPPPISSKKSRRKPRELFCHRRWLPRLLRQAGLADPKGVGRAARYFAAKEGKKELKKFGIEPQRYPPIDLRET